MVKKYKEVIFEWRDGGGDYHYKRRIVLDERSLKNKMIAKRFTQKDEDDWEILDSGTHFAYAHSSYQAEKIITELNELVDKNRELFKENEQLKQQLNEAVKQIHLVHMAGMFSTVKSFKGDVSKRYKYSEETDIVYDTANNYGRYDKVLDKKEMVMLLNEYETLLNGGEE